MGCGLLPIRSRTNPVGDAVPALIRLPAVHWNDSGRVSAPLVQGWAGFSKLNSPLPQREVVVRLFKSMPPMNAEQILLNFTDTKPDSLMAGVYVLFGCSALRITAAAQQHQAISLGEALVAWAGDGAGSRRSGRWTQYVSAVKVRPLPARSGRIWLELGISRAGWLGTGFRYCPTAFPLNPEGNGSPGFNAFNIDVRGFAGT